MNNKAEARRFAVLEAFKSDTTTNLSLSKGVENESDLSDLMVELEMYSKRHLDSGIYLDSYTQSFRVSHNVMLISNYLDSLEATRFERYVALLVKIFGYNLTYATKASHDQGIDFFGVKAFELFDSPRKSFLMGQAKKYNSLVTVEEIRNFAGSLFLMRSREFSQAKATYSSMVTRSFTPVEGLFATSYFFSPPALKLCENSDIICLDFVDLVLLTEKAILKHDLEIEVNDVFDAVKTDAELDKIEVLR